MRCLPLAPERLRPAHHVGRPGAHRRRVERRLRPRLVRPRADRTRDGQSPVEGHGVHLLVLAEDVQIVEIDAAPLAAVFQIVQLDLRPFVLYRGISHVHLRYLPCNGRSCVCRARCAHREHCRQGSHFHTETSHIRHPHRVKSSASMPRRSSIFPTIISTRSSSVSGRW